MNLIYSYTRREAIEDGFQSELPASLTQQLFKYPVFITSGVHALVQKAISNPKWGNDFEGVLWDILWMSRTGKPLNDSTRLFQVIITGTGRKKYHTLMVECGPKDIDNPAPALTIMLPEER